ncbi:MAG: PKD domain-containing protein [Flavobacterium sp.]|nr:PKD domain-containing protein [Flavobacterium sp.]
MSVCFLSNGQTITIDNTTFDVGPYGQGSSITVPITTTDCFNVGNVFNLYLSDNNGNFVGNGTLIGSFNGFFTTFVNGIIPASTPAGTGYRLRVVSTNPAAVVSNTTNAFEINASTGPTAKANPDDPDRILVSQIYFGWCSGIKNDSIVINNLSTSGATITTILKNEKTLSTSTPSLVGNQFSIPLDQNYYTLTVKAVLNGATSTTSYFIINSPNNMNLSSSGSQTGCLPNTSNFQILTTSASSSKGIGDNFPGTQYKVDWGDGTSSLYKHCQLIAGNGNIFHLYSNTSCTVNGGNFKVIATLQNPFYSATGTETQKNCEHPSFSTEVSIFQKPSSSFTFPQYACENQSVTFTNTSTPGQAQSGPSCVSSAKYSWFVDGSQVYSSTTPEATPPDLSRSFSTVGTHTIKLLVNNLSCAVSDTTRTICIEPIPAPDFTMNPGACVPTSFTPVNTTNSNPCRPMTFAWSILDSLGNNTVNASFYTISNASASQPLITITKLGKYQLQLAVTNSCSTVVKRQTITVGGTPTAILPAAQSYCGAKTIDFATDANHKPTYDSQFGTSPTYSWSVSGGTFSYGNGTSATSAFPQITFNNLATYTVSVTFSTNCGTATTVSQQITLGAAPDVTVPSDQTFCNGVPTGIFNFSSSLNGTNYSWVNNNPTIGLAANGNGSIASFIASNTTGVPVTATITVTPLNGCVGISKSFTITVNPGATIANAGTNQKLCNALSTTLSGNIPVVGTGSWSKVFGNTVVIDNPTIPTSTLSGLAPFDSVVLAWTIQNTSNTCGATSDTVFIINRPTITVANAGNDTIICDFITANNTINLFGNKDTTRSFEIGTWSIVSQPNGGNGIFSNSNSPFSKFSFSKAGSYILKWSISNDAGCTPSFKTVIIKVNDKPSKGLVVPAMPSICIGASTTLTLTGYSGSILKWQYNVNPISDNIWIDTILTSSSISFNNIQDTFALRAIVVSTDAFCQLSDTTTPVVINATPQPIGGVTGPDTTVCGANNNGIINLTGYFGTIIRWEKSTDNGTTWTPLVNTTNAHLYSTILQTTKFRAVIQNGNCSPVTSTITTITVAGATGNSNAGVDQFLCNQNSTQLNAAVPPNGITGTWLQVAGSPVTIANASLYNTSITGLTPNTYKLVWAISNGFCAATNDTVIVTNYPALVNAISAINTTICSGQSVSIIGQTPSGGNGIYSYQWQQSVDSINWINISGANLNNINYSPTFSVFVRRLVTSSTCSTPSNAAVVTVQAGVSNNSISGDTTICIGNSLATLIGLQPTGGNNIYTFQWENSVDGGITWLPIGTGISKDFTPANLTTTTKFRRVVTTSICFGLQASISNIVTITINQNAKALFTYSKDIDCATFNLASTITNNTNSANGAYLWYANGNLIGTGTSMPNYSITNAFDSVTIKLKVTSLFGCKNDSLEHKFYTIPIPIPAFTISDTVGCGPLLLTLSNKTPNASLFNFKWDFGNGVTSNLINPTGGIVLQPNPSRFDTVYNISLTAFTTCDTVTVSQKVRVKSKPQALFTPNKSVGCSPLPISFNNTSRGNNMTFVWNFGDGSAPITTSSTNTLQHTYSTGKQDTFNVTLIATNSCGSDTITYNIIVSPNTIKLDFAVNATDVTTCLPSTVRFINNTIGATSFNWDFGDGNVLTTTKNIDTVTHVYTKAGTFITKLTASNGCSDTTDYEQIKAYAKPIVKFTASPLTACLGDSVSFVNQTDTATGYTWHYGNGATSSLTSPTYVYGGAGTYNAMLIAVRQYPAITCTDSTFTTINIVAKLNGSFTMSDSVSTCVPFKVVFTNLSVPSVLTTWDYGDGVKDTGDLVQHTYTNSGTFTAKMTAVNAGGCTYETTKNIVVKGPTGTWIYDKGLICVNKSVQFQVNVLNTDSLHFNFGDGTSLTTTSPIVNHTYTQSGNYLPSVQLLSGACYVTLKGVDTIKIEKITAGFTTVQQKNCGSTTVGFTDTTRSFYGVQTWQWNYGDGTPVGQTQNTQHTYTVGNTYGVQLIVVGNSGCSDTANLQLPITINSKPNATIQANVTSCVNQSVNYSATITSVDSVVLKLWKFATGASAIGNTASYTYSNAGTYTTAFITGTINGCFDTTYNTITVNPSPTLVASADVTICKGASTPLLATGSSNVTWLPTNNLSCTTCANPLAFPAVTTAYVASSTNGFGCTSTDTVVVTVFQPFTISVTPSDSICVGQSTKLGASGAFSYTWAPATGLSNAAIQNPVASPLVTTTYQVTGTDQYNCFTATASVVIGVGNYPVVNLGQDQVLAAGSTYTFTPSVTNGPIASWLWKPSTNLDCTTCPSVTATAKNDVCYVAQATNIYGCASTDAVCVKVFCESSQVFIPNAFMPGTGTGKNDILMVRSTGIKLVKSFRIYNRWGQVVFERANFVPNDRTYGWNGLVHGKPADTDVYIYTCEVVCENDTPFVYKGNVAVIR